MTEGDGWARGGAVDPETGGKRKGIVLWCVRMQQGRFQYRIRREHQPGGDTVDRLVTDWMLFWCPLYSAAEAPAQRTI